MPASRQLDIDVIVDQLDKILHYQGEIGLVEAAALAPVLLRHDRYRGAADARAALAADITTAISKLPPEVRRDANAILPIDQPNASIAARLRAINMADSSAPGRRWHRIATLGRVAFQLHARYNAPAQSYRIIKTDIAVSRQELSLPTLGTLRRFLVIDLHWTIESLVRGLKWFDFSLLENRRLKLEQFAAQDDGYPCESIICASTSPRQPTLFLNESLYIVQLAEGFPVRAPTHLHIRFRFDKAGKGDPHLLYRPMRRTGSLSFSYERHSEAAAGCEELDQEMQVVKTFAPKTKETVEWETIDATEECVDKGVEIVDRFLIRSPRAQSYYRLKWPLH